MKSAVAFGYLFSVILLVLLNSTPSARADECAPATFDGAFDGEITLCQNWNALEQQEFWFTAQGSRIIPYRWFLVLEQAGSTEPFSSNANLDGFRYLPQKPTPLNPDGLPVGFTKDSVAEDDPYIETSSQWLGVTCSACHTGQVEHKGIKILIDGAPSMADLEGFMWALAGALEDTLNNPDKFNRFADKVVGKEGETAEDANTLKKQLQAVYNERDRWNKLNKGDHDYGFARLDAIGAIMNSVGTTAQFPGDDSTRHSANAPVSYPFIWDTPQHDKVQWNASVSNKDAGAIGRNIGEVLGVFGHLRYNPIDFKPGACLPKDAGVFTRLLSFTKNLIGGVDGNICFGHASSVKADGLHKVESLLWDLQSPIWPEDVLGDIDPAMATRGELIFKRSCLGCHDGRDKLKDGEVPVKPFERDDNNRWIQAQAIPVNQKAADLLGYKSRPVGTDPSMVTNFVSRTYPISESLQGQAKAFLNFDFPPKKQKVFGEKGGGVELLGYAVKGVVANKFLNDPENTINAILTGMRKPEEAEKKRFLEGVKTRLIEAQDANNLKRAEIILESLRLADKDDYIDWAKNIDKLDFESLIKKLKKLKDADHATLKGGKSKEQVQKEIAKFLVYKARPLNGIWATAPYLHNGSVRTIRQLMLPAECPATGEIDAVTNRRVCRQKTFKVGSREYDTGELGFKNDGGFDLDTTLPGNSNQGHPFGHRLFRADPTALDALLEYIKTL